MARPADAALQSSAIQHCRLHFREAALGETLGRASCGYFKRTKNGQRQQGAIFRPRGAALSQLRPPRENRDHRVEADGDAARPLPRLFARRRGAGERSEEHTSELQSLMRISYAVFCLKKKKKITTKT